MAIVQGGPGLIRLFTDFGGAGFPIAGSVDYANCGPFQIGGEGIEGNDAGVICQRSAGLSGVGQFRAGTTTDDATAIMTGFMFDVGLMAPIVLEVRVRFEDLDAKAVFIGFAPESSDDIQLTDILNYSAATTVTLTDAHIIGFWLSSELTDHEDWHAVHKGGTATAVTDTTAIDLDSDPTVGDWQILRLEIDPNGTVRWLIDGVIKKTLEGAVSTSADLAMVVGVSNNASAVAEMDVDYVLCTANRDWTI